jgi:uncharacterized protein (UPF0332 family)
MVNYLAHRDTERKLTIHDTPKHNGAAERCHRTIFNSVRAMLLASGLSCSLWEFAHAYVVYLFNHTAWCAIDYKTPYEV